MKDLIIAALDDAFKNWASGIPETKKVTKSISIRDVKPLELVSFMKANNIPDDAEFDGRDNGYDAWDDILLTWEIDVPTTDKDKRFYQTKFTSIAFAKVYNVLIANEYKRVGYNSGLMREFADTSVYDMYVNKDFDRLVKYYSLPFVKILIDW